ncbi:hypothetical protein [Methylobacterium nodulans]|uniref:Uncharacterized protein n=1 Tax=Methylobacterium nodulans (strain LMG 21967 / CNCM I-2342 / ORS 2060) TaxID=460265 RepID=B8IXD8_METNO|nr:hypothetical protein [Methylobacterium nodulans]ACL63179.1 hypothetical protein Mnod_8205 [Methylobacterium nodulans ORS 2060]
MIDTLSWLFGRADHAVLYHDVGLALFAFAVVGWCAERILGRRQTHERPAEG